MSAGGFQQFDGGRRGIFQRLEKQPGRFPAQPDDVLILDDLFRPIDGRLNHELIHGRSEKPRCPFQQGVNVLGNTGGDPFRFRSHNNLPLTFLCFFVDTEGPYHTGDTMTIQW